MTSCGCFECIACILPGTGGIMIVDREYSGLTPVGMTFSSLAEMTGGGQQTPGFIGIGTLYALSKNKWYVDEIYLALAIKVGPLLSELLWRCFDPTW